MFGAGLMKTVLALREAGKLPKPDPANPCNLADSVPGALGDALANAGFGRVAAEEWSYPIVIACVEINQCVGCTHFSAMTRPSWLGRAVRNEHQREHAVKF